MTTAVSTLTTSQIEKLAAMLQSTFVTADRGAITLGPDFSKGQGGTIQRTVNGVASENLAHFVYEGEDQWKVDKVSDEVSGKLELLEEDHPCFQHAVNVIHERFWTDDALGVDDVYKAAQEASVPQEWLDAFVLAKLNYQVCNGGFSQWVYNGYAILIKETRDALKRMSTETSWKLWTMVGTLEEHLDGKGQFIEEQDDDQYYTCDNCGGAGTIDEGDPDEDEHEVTCDNCGGSGEIEEEGEYYCPGDSQAEKIDEDFDYAISEKFTAEVERYVQGLPLDRVDPQEQRETPVHASCRYPKVKVQLVGQDSNAMSIISAVRKALRRAGVSNSEIEQYSQEATGGDYDNVLSTTMKWVVVE